jgi:tetratricopeptide (TPR) repeat protein
MNAAKSQQRKNCPAGAPGAPSVYIDSSASDVTIVANNGRKLVASKDLLLCSGDEVRTGPTGRVAIRFDEKRTVVRLDGNSRIRVLSGGTGTADASLLSGVLHFLSSVRQRFEVETPYIVAGIDGTEALVGVQPAQALAITAVREGLVSAYDREIGPDSTISVPAGEAAFRSATVRFQSAPISALPAQFRKLVIVSDSAVDWAVYFPPIMFVEDSGNRAVREAILLLSSGDYDRAAIALYAADQKDPARTAALRTIIAVARNRIEEAERWSALALSADANFAPAYIAASYVRQAKGDLDGALEIALKAAKISPDDAYVTARLAELQMTVGDRRAALQTAERSLAIRRTPLALFIAGIARLAAWQYDQAEALFSEAISLDPEAPLPRLGLGLAYIRQGKTAAGAWEIERAVAHDPRGAALRTWLGRAYFDEGLTEKASEQFRQSIKEDDEDPTPRLFAALERYAANDPIGALRELQAAEERGGARRVIRSQRGLREDDATRGAAIGRIYDILGFEQLAITEGAKAADADPANPGGHRFLADAYRQRPGYEIAQTSELLRSQLLSPPSKTPVQPELAEADLALLDTTGASRVTFAEFSPLFDADGLRLDAAGQFGSQHTWSDQVSVTGLYRGASISIGQYHYETLGYRDNNDLQHDIFDAVATFALSPEFTLFGEYRFRETKGGDRPIDFDIDDFDDTIRSQLERNVARLGFHAQPSTDSDIIGVYTWANLSSRDSIIDPMFGTIVTTAEDDSHHLQLQYIHQYKNIKSVIGGNYINNNVNESVDIGGFFTISDRFNIDYYNGYAYFYLDAPEEITWTIGGAFAGYEESSGRVDSSHFLPKIGVNAKINDYIAVRAAYLRNLKPDLVSEQVLEPTTVAGFNQFYDGFNGSVIDQIGGGIDARINPDFMVGGEAIGRWWDVPRLGLPDGEIFEQVFRAYAYLTVTDQIAVAAELIHEQSEVKNFASDFDEWQTTSVPLTISYFSEAGVFGSLGLEFVDHGFTSMGVENSDSFHLVNAVLGYRLPDSRGILSVEVRNLFDEDFHYQNRTRRPDIAAQPRYAPERTIYARGSIRF